MAGDYVWGKKFFEALAGDFKAVVEHHSIDQIMAADGLPAIEGGGDEFRFPFVGDQRRGLFRGSNVRDPPRAWRSYHQLRHEEDHRFYRHGMGFMRNPFGREFMGCFLRHGHASHEDKLRLKVFTNGKADFDRICAGSRKLYGSGGEVAGRRSDIGGTRFRDHRKWALFKEDLCVFL